MCELVIAQFIYSWLAASANQLSINMTKTEFMLIASRQKLQSLSSDPPVLEMNGERISQVHSSKSLGVIIDEHLSWNTHIDNLAKKVGSALGAIKRIRNCIPHKTLLSIYQGLVQTHFDYCSVVWGNCGSTLKSKLQKLQNRASRIVTFSSFDADAQKLRNQLGWHDLETQRAIFKAQMVYKSLNHLTPSYLSSRFIHRSDISSAYNLRNSENKLAIPLPRTNYYKNSFSYSGAKLWNSLPLDVRLAESLTKFRTGLNSFYTV